MMAFNDTGSDNESMWYLDTATSNQITESKHFFVNMQEIDDGHVSFGNASKDRVNGQRKYVSLKMVMKKGRSRVSTMSPT